MFGPNSKQLTFKVSSAQGSLSQGLGVDKLQSSYLQILSHIFKKLWARKTILDHCATWTAAANFWPSSSSRSRVIDLSKSLMWACQDLRSQSRVIRDVSPSIRKISQDQENWCKNFHSPVSCSQCILWPSFLDLFILQNWIALGLDNFKDLNFWLHIQTKVLTFWPLMKNGS